MRRWFVALYAGSMVVLALLPRVLGLADFYTIDEGYHWPGRVERFSAALAAGDWAATNQTGHPGVTTMWLGALGRWLAGWFGIIDPGWAGGGAAYLALLRLPLALTNGLAVLAGYLILRRLLSGGTALLAALLWAGSPFLIAHSRVLHLDALLTTWMTLSLLLLLAATQAAPATPHPLRRWLFALSSACAGLALLTKSPSLVLLPWAGLVLLLEPAGPPWSRLGRVVLRYSLWLGGAALVALLGWPALWQAPLATIGSVLREVVENGGEPHHSGNFFLGQPVADPGPLFYPAVLLWRTSPLTLIGLLALPLTLWRARAGRVAAFPWRTVLALLGFVLLFGLALSVEPKKFDRYLLPVWPALEVLAAVGLAGLAGALAAWRLGWAALAARWALPVVVLATLVWCHPYYLGYFNPLLGGGATAQRVMLVGWGEGMEQVGAWLRVRPDLVRGPVLSWIPPTLAPFVPASTQVLDLRESSLGQPSSYTVLYSRSLQRQESAVAAAYAEQTPPLYTLRWHGLTYASIHQLPRPFTTPHDVLFGSGLHLRGFSQQLLGNTLLITPSWDIQADGPGGQVAFIHLLDAAGARVAQVDAPLDQGMFAQWQAGQQFDSPLPVALPPDLPPGEYRVVLGLYNPQSGVRHLLQRGPALPEPLAGPGVTELTRFRY